MDIRDGKMIPLDFVPEPALAHVAEETAS